MKFYRFEEKIRRGYGYDYNGEVVFSNFYEFELKKLEYELVKETPKGYWISLGKIYTPRWVSKTAVKRYAYPSEQEALNSFIKRKEKQIRILSLRLSHAKEMLTLANDKVY